VRICREEDANAVNLNSIRLLFLLACTPLTCRDLTPLFFWIQERLGVELIEFRSRRPRPDARVAFLWAMPGVSPLSGLGLVRRVAPTHRRRRGKLLGEPPSLPAPVRVSALPPRGRRKTMAASRRSPLDLTARLPAYRFGPSGR
jgi:hypothetical protein